MFLKMVTLNSRFSCNVKIVCQSDHVYAYLLWLGRWSGIAREMQNLVFQSGGEWSFLPLPLSDMDRRLPSEAEMRSGQGAFCSVWFCLSVTLIVARNSCFSQVQTCRLFSVEAGRMSEVMFEF